MTMQLPGYTVGRLLRSSAQGRVYEVERASDGVPLVARFIALDPRLVARVEHEVGLTQELDIEGVIPAIAVQQLGDQIVVLRERTSAVPLDRFNQGSALDLGRFFALALDLSAKLAKVHGRGLVHGDLKPASVLVREGGQRVFLVDFGVPSILDSQRRGRIALRNSDDEGDVEESLPYASPEQSGWIKRAIDARSDLYSLGVLFYEQLTGRRPFEGSSSTELVQAHLVRRARAPIELRPDMPELLSSLVMKLLEKAPEHRYQSAAGLLADLETIAASDRCGEAVSTEIGLGRGERATRLQLPYQLFGRADALGVLESELSAALEHRQTRTVVVYGEVGSGKSALLEAFEAPVAGRWGLLGTGCFDPLDRARPYQGFVEAATGLVAQLLGESESRRREWVGRLRSSLGSVAQVMVDLVPALAPLIGRGEPLEPSEPDGVENRLRLGLVRFLAALGERGPLVLVLDDLQWADPDSLALLRFLAGAGTGAPLLIVACVRGNRDAADAMAAAIEPRRLRTLGLGALGRPELEAMLTATLGEPREVLTSLTDQVEARTGGNPRAVRLLLHELAARGLLWVEDGRWSWSEEALEEAVLPEDGPGFLDALAGRLAPETRALLWRAGCVGLAFEVPALEAVAGVDGAAVAAGLHELGRAGVLVEVGHGYRFVHSAVRELGFERLAEAGEAVRRALVEHLLSEVGLELDSWPRPGDELALEGLGDRLFELVHHLEHVEHVEHVERVPSERIAWLFARAGHRAMREAAWWAARRYLGRAVGVLSKRGAEGAGGGDRTEGVDRTEGAGAFELHFSHAQALALTRENAGAEAAFEALLATALTVVERARVVARRCRISVLLGRPEQGLSQGLDELERMGFRVPRPCTRFHQLRRIGAGWLATRKLSRAAWMALPEARDPDGVAAMEVLTQVKRAAFVTDHPIFLALCGLHASLVVRHGFHPSAPMALAELGHASVGALREPGGAGELCAHAVALNARLRSPAARAYAEIVACLCVWPTCRPWAVSAERVPELVRAALEAGEMGLAGRTAANGLGLLLRSGVPLSEVVEAGRSWRAELEPWAGPELEALADASLGLAEVLIGEPEAGQSEIEGIALRPASRSSSDASDRLARLSTQSLAGLGGLGLITIYGIASAQITGLWLLGHRTEAGTLLDELSDFERVLSGSWYAPRLTVLLAVSSGVRHAQGDQVARLQARAALRGCLRTIRRWAEGCKANFGAAATLVEAELARAQDRWDQAMACYERAMMGARERGQRVIEIIAGERLAELADARGRTSSAVGARAMVVSSAQVWGSSVLALRLSELEVGVSQDGVGDFSDSATGEFHVSPSQSVAGVVLGPTVASGSGALMMGAGGSGSTFDVDTVLAMSQVITEDLRLEEVVARVLDTALASSGADRGQLLLEREGAMSLVAEGTPECIREFMGEPVLLSEANSRVPVSAVRHVMRTGRPLVVDRARVDPRFASDPYVLDSPLRSLLCMPIAGAGDLIGAVVLENHRSDLGFAADAVAVLRMFIAQARSALDNASLYQALQRSEAHWRSLVDGVPDMICVLDPGGRIEFVNHPELFGDGDAKEGSSWLIGRSAAEFMATSEGPAWSRVVQAAVERGEALQVEAALTPQGGGPPRAYDVRLSPILVSGEVGRVISIATDVTQRRAMAIERANLEAQSRQQQRLESIGTLASGVAHEINNPVQGIMNYADLISSRPKDTRHVLEFADEIIVEAKRVATIVRNLLSFSRQEREVLELEAIEVSVLVESTLSLIRAVLRRDQIDIVVDVPPGQLKIRCRIQQIQQILLNLVTNARDALNERYPSFSEQKRIEIRAQSFARGGGVNWLRLSVQDGGNGVPAQIRAQIFDPFFTTKGRYDGTGLGLSVSHGIAAEHGGELRFETELGIGTVFHLELPAESPTPPMETSRGDLD